MASLLAYKGEGFFGSRFMSIEGRGQMMAFFAEGVYNFDDNKK